MCTGEVINALIVELLNTLFTMLANWLTDPRLVSADIHGTPGNIHHFCPSLFEQSGTSARVYDNIKALG